MGVGYREKEACYENEVLERRERERKRETKQHQKKVKCSTLRERVIALGSSVTLGRAHSLK